LNNSPLLFLSSEERLLLGQLVTGLFKARGDVVGRKEKLAELLSKLILAAWPLYKDYLRLSV
jgi:hypothetical protein